MGLCMSATFFLRTPKNVSTHLQHTNYDIFLGRLWAWPIVRLVLHLSLECLGNAVYEVPSVKGRCHHEPFPNATGAGFRPSEGLEDDKMQSIWGAFTLRVGNFPQVFRCQTTSPNPWGFWVGGVVILGGEIIPTPRPKGWRFHPPPGDSLNVFPAYIAAWRIMMPSNGYLQIIVVKHHI